MVFLDWAAVEAYWKGFDENRFLDPDDLSGWSGSAEEIRGLYECGAVARLGEK